MKRKHVLCTLAVTLSLAVGANEPVTPGSRWIYKEPSGREWCVIVVALDTGVDAEPWAWFTFIGDARRSGHVPMSTLRDPCRAGTP